MVNFVLLNKIRYTRVNPFIYEKALESSNSSDLTK